MLGEILHRSKTKERKKNLEIENLFLEVGSVLVKLIMSTFPILNTSGHYYLINKRL